MTTWSRFLHRRRRLSRATMTHTEQSDNIERQTQSTCVDTRRPSRATMTQTEQSDMTEHSDHDADADRAERHDWAERPWRRPSRATIQSRSEQARNADRAQRQKQRDTLTDHSDADRAERLQSDSRATQTEQSDYKATAPASTKYGSKRRPARCS